MRIEKFREWLERNKIFFDTLGILLLSGMAVLVSLAVLNITSYQTQLMEKEHYPFFNVLITPDYDIRFPDDENPKDYLTIENLGDPVTEFFAHDLVFINISNKDNENHYSRVPLYHYYGGIVSINGSLNNWHSVGNQGDYRAIGRLTTNLTDYATAKGLNITTRIERYIKIEYRDKWGDKGSQFFNVREYSTERISESRGISIENEYNNKMDNRKGLTLGFRFDYNKAFSEFLQNKFDEWIDEIR